MRTTDKVGKLLRKLRIDPSPMKPLDFFAVEVALMVHHREHPSEDVTSIPVCHAPAGTVYAFPNAPDPALAKANFCFYARIRSAGHLKKLLDLYRQCRSAALAVGRGAERNVVVRDAGALARRAPEYDALLDALPADSEVRFAGRDSIEDVARVRPPPPIPAPLHPTPEVEPDIDDTWPTETLLLDTERPRDDPVVEIEVDRDSSRAWRAVLPLSAWDVEPEVRPAVVKGVRRRRSIDLDAAARHAGSAHVRRVLGSIGFLKPDMTTSRSLHIEDRCHIPSMVNTGKTTLCRTLMHEEAEGKGRTCFVARTIDECRALARDLQREGADPSSIVIWLGEKKEEEILEAMEATDVPFDTPDVLDLADYALIGPGCPLRACAVADGPPAAEGSLPDRGPRRPCDRLTVTDAEGSAVRIRCPLFESCPATERHRRLRDCAHLITTLPALMHVRVSAHIDPHEHLLAEFVHRNFSLVLLDEADALQVVADEASAFEHVITGTPQGIVPNSGRAIANHAATGHTALSAPDVNEFVGKSNSMIWSSDRLLMDLHAGGLSEFYDSRLLFQDDFILALFDELVSPSIMRAVADPSRKGHALAKLVQAVKRTLRDEIVEASLRHRTGRPGGAGAIPEEDDRDPPPHPWKDPEIPRLVRECYARMLEMEGTLYAEDLNALLAALVGELGAAVPLNVRSHFTDDTPSDLSLRARVASLLSCAFLTQNIARIASFFIFGTHSPAVSDALGTDEFLPLSGDLRPLMPLVVSGLITGISIHQDRDSGNILGEASGPPGRTVTLVLVEYVGRHFLDALERLFSPYAGTGPLCVRLSGSSYNPLSTETHVRVPVSALLGRLGPDGAVSDGIGAVSRSTGHYRPQPDPTRNGDPLAIMGSPLSRRNALIEARADLLRDGGLDDLLDLAHGTGRRRALVVTGPIRDACTFVKRAVGRGLVEERQAGYLMGASGKRSSGAEGLGIARVDIEREEKLRPLRLLAASRHSITRGHNLMVDGQPAFSVIVFLSAPHPVPTSTSLARSWLMRRSCEIYDALPGAAFPVTHLKTGARTARLGYLRRSVPYVRGEATAEIRAEELAGEIARRLQTFGRGIRNDNPAAYVVMDPQEVDLLNRMARMLRIPTDGGGRPLDAFHKRVFRACFKPLRTVVVDARRRLR